MATRITILSEFPRLLNAGRNRRAAGPDPSQVEIPDTEFAKAVIDLCDGLDETLRAHSYRSYIFGRSLATVEGEKCDEEALFAATMLHNYGLQKMVEVDDECFTLVSADLVKEFLASVDFADEKAQRAVLDAITRQLNPVVDLRRHGPIQRFAHAGILFDMFGIRARELDPEGVAHVFEIYPRYEFTSVVSEILRKHGEKARRSRTHDLFVLGLGRSLELSPWRKLDGSS